MLWLLVLAAATGVLLGRRQRAPAALLASLAGAVVAFAASLATGDDTLPAALRAAAAAAVLQAGYVAGLFIWDAARRPDGGKGGDGGDGAA